MNAKIQFIRVWLNIYTERIIVHFSKCIFLSKRDSIKMQFIRNNYFHAYGLQVSGILKYFCCVAFFSFFF